MAASFTRRAIGAVSRRTRRPELLAAFYAGARREQREELALTAALAALLGAGASYVDVGSNRGQLLAEALRLAPTGRHIAFEPIPELALELRRRFPGVDVRERALDASPGRARFCHFTELDGWSGLRRNPAVSDEQGRPRYLEVEVSTLDEQLAGLRPEVVKIDVEGAELGVLEGARGLLAQARPAIVFEHVAQTSAIYEQQPGRVWELLHEARYRVTSITGEGPFDRDGFLAAGALNWLALPER